jgi:hypothetical protein
MADERANASQSIGQAGTARYLNGYWRGIGYRNLWPDEGRVSTENDNDEGALDFGRKQSWLELTS